MKIIAVSRSAKWGERLQSIFVDRSISVLWEARLDRVLEHFEEDTYDILIVTDAAFKNGEIDSVEILEVIGAECPVTQILFLAEAEDEAMNRYCLECEWKMKRIVGECFCSLPMMDEPFSTKGEFKGGTFGCGSWIWAWSDGSVYTCKFFSYYRDKPTLSARHSEDGETGPLEKSL